MGLDIDAYRGLTPRKVTTLRLPGTTSEVWRPAPGILVTEHDYPGRAEGIDPSIAYSYKERYCFRVGRVDGYVAWRTKLATAVGGLDVDEDGNWSPVRGPFWELCQFSDYQGVIGPAAAAKLANDFRRHFDKAVAIDGHFLEQYRRWWQAFGTAGDGGAVEFR